MKFLFSRSLIVFFFFRPEKAHGICHLKSDSCYLSFSPGWDKHSYGYHGDDGYSFCSSGTGQPYGPTFTTGDVIGCCVNLINNTCFYTKNGHSLGNRAKMLPVLSEHTSLASKPAELTKLLAFLEVFSGCSSVLFLFFPFQVWPSQISQ